MLKFTMVGDDKVKVELQGAGERVQKAAEVGISRATLKVLMLAKLNLSGVVLNVKTGRLRRSLNQRIEGRGTTNVKGIVGTNVSYGKVHEFGGPTTIREHQRMMTKAWGKVVKNPRPITVHAHSMNYLVRSFLRNALQGLEESGELQKTLQQAIDEEFKKT